MPHHTGDEPNKHVEEPSMSPRASDLVIGLGSPHGDDCLGWRLVELLAPRWRPGRALAVAEPLRLLNALEGMQRLWIVDACQANQPPGSWVRCVWPALPAALHRGTSTHAMPLVDVLHLGQHMGTLPATVIVYGVQMGRPAQPLQPLSAEVQRTLEPLAARLLAEADSGDIGDADACDLTRS